MSLIWEEKHLDSVRMIADVMYDDGINIPLVIQEMKICWITKALFAAKFNSSNAAKKLGIHRNTFWRWIKSSDLTIDRKNRTIIKRSNDVSKP